MALENDVAIKATAVNGEAAPLLSMRGIVKRYGQAAALDGVDLEIRAGEIHALLGENGAGKSTLMHVLSGLTTPDKGNILLAGREVHFDTPRKASEQGIAMVHQHFTLVPALTVFENLALAETTPSSLSSSKLSVNKQSITHLFSHSIVSLIQKSAYKLNYRSEAVAVRTLDRANALGWPLDGQARISDLPVGVQQRVEIVKALATDARILIFDEPTAVLTGEEVENLFKVLQRLRAEGHAIILIAHKLAEIMAVGDIVTVLHRGRNVATVPVSAVTTTELAQWMVSGLRTQTSVVKLPPLVTVPVVDAPEVKVDANIGYDSIFEPVLIAVGLNVCGDRGELALRDTELQVRSGEILGIGGVDGNGQTELAEALVGLRSLKSGTITWKGGAFDPGVSPHTGYIPQDRRRAGLALTLSVEDNLLFAAMHDSDYRWGPFINRHKLMALADSLRKIYDIRAESGRVPVSSLSGGNQQKIVVARALSPQPELIVAVNPTRGLDIGATQFVHTQIRKAKTRGAAIILISTDLDEIAALSDRQAILSSGSLTEYISGAQDPVQIGLLLGGLGV